MRVKYLIITLIFILLSTCAILSSLLYNIKTDNISFRVQKGESAFSIAKRLKQNGVILSEKLFLIYTRISKIDRKLTSGLFCFHGDFSIIDVARHLEENKIVLHKVTIPEALTKNEIYSILESKGFGNVKNYVYLEKDTTWVRSKTRDLSNNLEGFLYPETYSFPENISEIEIINTMTDHFFNQLSTVSYQSQQLSIYEILKLASIVEEEAIHAEEKPKIASVYLNRVKINQKLEADPTIAYALKLSGKIRKKIYYKDLEINSPYNTYKKKGLPPTPICNPSISAIEAVLNPLETQYYFFFAGNDGYHIFSKNFRNHNKKLRLQRRKKQMNL